MTIAFFSFPRERAVHTIFLVLIMGTIVATYVRQFPESGRGQKWPIKRRPFLITMVIICGYYFFVEFGLLASDIYIKQGLAAREKSDWEQVIHNFGMAESPYMVLDYAATPLAWYMGEAYFISGDLANAHEQFVKAAVVHPYHLHVLNNLATSFAGKDDYTKAIFYYEKALSISPTNEELILNLGATYINAGKYAEASIILKRVKKSSNRQRLNLYLETLQNKITE